MTRIRPVLFLLFLATPLVAQEVKPITFEVILPADAVLVIDEMKTTSTGEKRLFETPAVAIGKTYAYTLKATAGAKTVSKMIRLTHAAPQVIDLRTEFVKKETKPTMPPVEPKQRELKKGSTAPGYVTYIEEGRLWVFKTGSKDLAGFEKDGPSDKHITRIGAGPSGMTVKAPDAETLEGFLKALKGDTTTTPGPKPGPKAPGYSSFIVEGRLWVFKEGSKELAAFNKEGPSDKHITRIGAGPMGMTIKAPDVETLDGFLKAIKDKK